MKTASFIASKLQKPEKGSFSAIISWIAIGGIAVGIFVILISFAILFGFQRNVTDKIFSFGGHIQLTLYDLSQSYESRPIRYNPIFRDSCLKHPYIKSVNLFSNKAGLLQSNNAVLGVLLKGIDRSYDTSFFSANLRQGHMPSFSDSSYSRDILISTKIARLTKAKIGDELVLYFMQNPPRVRKLKVCGIYETGMEEFDEVFVIGDLNMVRKINNWPDTLIGGYEIYVNRFEDLDSTANFVYNAMDYEIGLDKITDTYESIFDWLTVLKRNVLIFLVIIVSVACFNMASILLIMITERTHMIGVLKALGASNGLIGQIFYMNGVNLIIKGMLLGNLLAITFCAAQYYLKIIPLNPENYYTNSVPIYWDWYTFLAMNVLLLVANLIIVWIPLVVINSIKPIRAIRFN